MTDLKEYTEANRQAWNETMTKHQKANKIALDEAFSKPGYVFLSDPALTELQTLGVTDKSVVHLCCNNGKELMSLKNLGAEKCVGFDISDMAIEEASQRNKQFKLGCEFQQYDIYDIPDTYYGQFDIVFITIGALGWMPDLSAFFAVCNKLLKQQGAIFIYEQHPIAEIFPQSPTENSDPLKVMGPYFKKEPYEEESGLDYVGGTEYESKKSYWFVWTISDIIMCLINNGLSIQRFIEYPEAASPTHNNIQNTGMNLPLSYIILAKK